MLKRVLQSCRGICDSTAPDFQGALRDCHSNFAQQTPLAIGTRITDLKERVIYKIACLHMCTYLTINNVCHHY